MREILFRGKDFFSNKWHYGYFTRIKFEDNVFISNEYFSVSVMPRTVGQYIGIKDNNHKKIFEGDILKGRMSSIGKFKGVVIYNGYQYGIQCRKGYIFSFHDVDNCFIIGNKYDNKDLLEWEIARFLED